MTVIHKNNMDVGGLYIWYVWFRLPTHRIKQKMKNVGDFEGAPWIQGDLLHTELVLYKGPISDWKVTGVILL